MIARRPSLLLGPAVVLVGLGFAGFFGLLLSVQAILPLAALVGMMVMVAVMWVRPGYLLWMTVASALVLAGAVSYFGGIGQAQWLPIGLGAAMYGVVLFHAIGSRIARRNIPALLVWGAAFVAVAVVSSVWEGLDAGHWIYGARYCFAMASLLLALAYLPWDEKTIHRLWIFVLMAALLQLPLALYQYAVVGGSRIGVGADGVAWDAVVGTMGGKQEGGGHSAALGFFVVAAFLVVFSLWKRGLVSTAKVAGFTAVVLGVIFLAEVKAMVVIMPLGVALVLRSQVMQHIRHVILGMLLVLLLALTMPTLYSKLHYERAGLAPVSTTEFYERIIQNADSEHLNKGTQQLGRVAQIVFWWRQHDVLREPKEFLIGHGLGTTNAARLYVGEVVRQYAPLSVTNTAGGILLWETGLIGFGLVLAGIFFSALAGFRLSRRPEVPPFHQAALEAGAVILMILIPALFYKHFALKSPAVQVLVFLAAGQCLFWQTSLAQTMHASRRVKQLVRRPWVYRISGL